MNTSSGATAPGFDAVTFRELLRTAWRRFRALWWSAINVALFVGLVLMAIMLCLILLGNYLQVDLAIIMAAGLVLVLPLLASYQYIIIRDFEASRVVGSDVFRCGRRPWVGPLFLFAAVMLLPHAGITELYRLLAGPPAVEATHSLWLLHQPLGLGPLWLSALLGLVVAVPTFLIGPILLASPRPGLNAALKSNLRLLRDRPSLVISVAAFILVSTAVRSLPDHAALLLQMIGKIEPLHYPRVLGIAQNGCYVLSLIVYLFHIFLVAALYRAAFGSPLTPPTAGAEADAAPGPLA